MYKREVSVFLFGFGAQTTGEISTKFGMRYPIVPVGNLKILFSGWPPQGGHDFRKTQKSILSPYGPGQRAESVCSTFCDTFWVFFLLEILILFNGPSGARPVNNGLVGFFCGRTQLVVIYFSLKNMDLSLDYSPDAVECEQFNAAYMFQIDLKVRTSVHTAPGAAK